MVLFFVFFLSLALLSSPLDLFWLLGGFLSAISFVILYVFCCFKFNNLSAKCLTNLIRWCFLLVNSLLMHELMRVKIKHVELFHYLCKHLKWITWYTFFFVWNCLFVWFFKKISFVFKLLLRFAHECWFWYLFLCFNTSFVCAFFHSFSL